VLWRRHFVVSIACFLSACFVASASIAAADWDDDARELIAVASAALGRSHSDGAIFAALETAQDAVDPRNDVAAERLAVIQSTFEALELITTVVPSDFGELHGRAARDSFVTFAFDQEGTAVLVFDTAGDRYRFIERGKIRVGGQLLFETRFKSPWLLVSASEFEPYADESSTGLSSWTVVAIAALACVAFYGIARVIRR